MKNTSKLRGELIQKLVCIECYSPMEQEDSKLICKNCNKQYLLFKNEVPIFTKLGINEFSTNVFNSPPETYLLKLKKNVETFIRSKSLLFKIAKMLIWIISKATHPILIIKYLFSFILWFPVLYIMRGKNKKFKNVTKNHNFEEIINGSDETSKKMRSGAPFGWYLKSLEAYYFRQYLPQEPSLEFGGGNGIITNWSYGGQCRITYGSEIFADVLIQRDGSLHPDLYKVYDSLHISLATKLPFPVDYFSTVLSMHIIDHVVDIEDLLKEISRVLKKGGLFVASTYSDSVLKSLPDFLILSKFNFLSDKYIDWRLRRKNARGGIAYIREGSYPTGQNCLSLVEWERLAEDAGLKINKVIPFTYNWLYSLLMDLEYLKFPCPNFLRKAILEEVDKFSFKEIIETPIYEDSGNVFFVFEKI